MHKHVDSDCPPDVPDESLQRGHPPEVQFVRFRGVPLYPVLMTRWARTSTQPTCRRMQFERRAARLESVMK